MRSVISEFYCLLSEKSRNLLGYFSHFSILKKIWSLSHRVTRIIFYVILKFYNFTDWYGIVILTRCPFL